ncbi:MAG: transposase [Azoarcus sp. PHD]|nr:MAG: transposase [Azoarcus sp. PHD]
MEVGKLARRRRTHTEEFKQAVLAACRETGASVAGVALANGLNANQVRRWMRERGVAAPRHRLAAQSPLPERSAVPAFVPVAIAPTVSNTPDIHVEIQRGNTTIKLEWPVQAAGDCAAWLRDWLR